MPIETRNLLDDYHLTVRTSSTNKFILGDQILANARTCRLVDSDYKYVGFVRLTRLELRMD